METVRALNRRYEAVTWGALLVWWGVTELFPLLPDGTGAAGIGLILLGSNAARSLSGMPTNGFTMTLGILALVLGGLELARPVLRLPLEFPVFAVLLVVFGVILIVRGVGARGAD